MVTWWHSDICEIWRYAPWICNVESLSHQSLSQSWKEQLWVKAKKSARMPSQPKSAKNSNLSPKNSPDRFQGKKHQNLKFNHFFHPFFFTYFTPVNPWPPPVMTPGMTRPTALRSCGAGTGATAAALGVCRPKTIFASCVADRGNDFWNRRKILRGFFPSRILRGFRGIFWKNTFFRNKMTKNETQKKEGEGFRHCFFSFQNCDISLNGFRAEHPKCFRSAPAWREEKNTRIPGWISFQRLFQCFLLLTRNWLQISP